MSLPLAIYHVTPRRLPHSLGFNKYALGFHGAEYVYVGDSPSLQISDKIVVELMAKPRERNGMWIGKYTNVISTYNIYDAGDPYGWVFRLRGADGIHYSVYSYMTVLLNKWYHIMGTYDKTEQRLYINGKLVASRLLSIDLDPTIGGHFSIGARYKSHDIIECFIIGDIAFVRVYNSKLFNWLISKGWSVDDFVEYNMLNYHKPVSAGLVLWLNFEEGFGNTTYDKSGYNNNGTIYGATWEKLKIWELRTDVGL